MTLIWPWTLQGQRYPYTCWSNATGTEFYSFSFHGRTFPDNWGFWFSIGTYNGEWQLKISNISNVIGRGALGGNAGQVWKRLAAICRSSNVLKISLQLDPMLTKTKNNRQNFDFQNLKNPKRTSSFVRTTERKIREKLQTFGCNL